MSNSRLEILNFGDDTSCTDKTFTMIDHCSISKDPINGYVVTAILLNSNDFLVTFETNLSYKPETDNLIMTESFSLFSLVKMFRDLGFREWWNVVK